MGDNRNGFRLFDAAEQDAFLDFTGAAAANSGFAVLVAFRADSIQGGNIRDTVFVNHGNAATANSFGLKYQGGTPQFFALGTVDPAYRSSGIGRRFGSVGFQLQRVDR